MTGPSPRIDRRAFLRGTGGTAALTALSSRGRASGLAGANAGLIFKSVKWGMIGAGDSILEKFQIQKELGYDGMELISPGGLDTRAILAASRQTGMPVHGVVDMVHWNQRLSSPSTDVRRKGRDALEGAIRDAAAFGGSSVLLVPGKVTGEDETHQHVWDRSIREIRHVLPLASRLGIRVLIENVWNGFCEAPEEMRDYIDQINSPWVGAYFDIGNHQKFGGAVKWIRVLNYRIVKLDIKDWGVKNGFCKIGDGDVDWPEVRRALADIGFSGWCTAEVRGGGKDRLLDIAQRMNRVLAL